MRAMDECDGSRARVPGVCRIFEYPSKSFKVRIKTLQPDCIWNCLVAIFWTHFSGMRTRHSGTVGDFRYRLPFGGHTELGRAAARQGDLDECSAHV